ncbi:MAG: hypothetical protein NC299_18555 [Lachnospiraceae bacterium]|nr:hypothetical protein [Ruminococcus sp.]MCM1277330.1 hypothetical protein [Lachnospiraceae bacterium]
MQGKTFSLLGRRSYRISDNVSVNIPTVGMVRGENEEDETDFWQEVGLFTTSSYDMVIELDDMGLDFTKTSDYTVFLIQFLLWRDDKLKNNVPDLLFNEFNLWELQVSEANGETVFVDENGDVVIDENAYNRLSELLTYVTGHEKPKRIKYDDYLRKQYVEDCRESRERRKKRKKENDRSGGALDGIILRLVCNANFPYDFETVNNVTLFDLIYALKQIEKDNSVTDLMQSRLVGADLKKIPKERFSRFVL